MFKINEKKFNLIVLCLGIIGFIFNIYFFWIYCIIHFTVVILKKKSRFFNEKLETFSEDQKRIKKHYKENWNYLYFFCNISRLFSFFFFYSLFFFPNTGSNDVSRWIFYWFLCIIFFKPVYRSVYNTLYY